MYKNRSIPEHIKPDTYKINGVKVKVYYPVQYFGKAAICFEVNKFRKFLSERQGDRLAAKGINCQNHRLLAKYILNL